MALAGGVAGPFSPGARGAGAPEEEEEDAGPDLAALPPGVGPEPLVRPPLPSPSPPLPALPLCARGAMVWGAVDLTRDGCRLWRRGSSRTGYLSGTRTGTCTSGSTCLGWPL